MPVSHVSLAVPAAKWVETCAFYANVLKPLGYKEFLKIEGITVGMAPGNFSGPDFWLHRVPAAKEGAMESHGGDIKHAETEQIAKTHVAFDGSGTGAVRQWYQNALKAGAKSNGEPGERPEYMKGYYAAYVLDPVGNNIEVVYFDCWWMKLLKPEPYLYAFGVLSGVGAAWLYAARG